MHLYKGEGSRIEYVHACCMPLSCIASNCRKLTEDPLEVLSLVFFCFLNYFAQKYFSKQKKRNTA